MPRAGGWRWVGKCPGLPWHNSEARATWVSEGLRGLSLAAHDGDLFISIHFNGSSPSRDNLLHFLLYFLGPPPKINTHVLVFQECSSLRLLCAILPSFEPPIGSQGFVSRGQKKGPHLALGSTLTDHKSYSIDAPLLLPSLSPWP